MSPKRTSLKHRFKARFVAWCEVVGYLICALVAAFSIYALTVKRDIVVVLGGELAPGVLEYNAPADLLVTAVPVTAGDLVEGGTKLMSYAADDTDRRRARARVALDQAREALSLLRAEEAASARALVAEALDIVPTDARTEDLAATARGLAYPRLPWKPGDEQPAGEVLYTVYSLETLTLTTSVPPQGDFRRLETGQAATVTLDGIDLQGTISTITQGETTLDVTVVFEVDTIDEVAGPYRTHFESNGTGTFPGVQARVMVGERNLFLELFGRR